jgi:putative ABC transport system permease protein
MGMNNIIIRNKEKSETSSSSTNFSAGLSLKDGKAIQEICSLTEAIAPQWEVKEEARYKDSRSDIRIVGTTPEYLSIYNYKIKTGKFLMNSHIEGLSNVCVIGSGAKNELFHYEDPIGKMIKMQDLWFEVIGVLEKKSVNSKGIGDMQISDVNLDVFIPISTSLIRLTKTDKKSSREGVYYSSSRGGVGKYIDKTKIDQLTIKIKSAEEISQANQIIKSILDRRHYNSNDFVIIIPEELLRQSQKTQRIFNIVMGAIAGISLLVGGIGIMNIMLASVLERTKEIGVRRAIGASRADILTQFLVEAVALSIVGGIIGIGLGFGMTKIISIYAGWKTIVNLWSIILAFGVSVATGIVFGIYPAKSAAEKEPIEALRYE